MRSPQLSGETINLGVPTPLGVEHLAQEDSRHFVGGTNWVGRRVPYESTANGKVLHAFALDAPADGREIRARGYATAVDELEHGLAALAAPVFGPDGDAVAALSISGPTSGSPATASPSSHPPCSSRRGLVSMRLGNHDQRGAA